MSQSGHPVYGEVPRYGHHQPASSQPATRQFDAPSSPIATTPPAVIPALSSSSSSTTASYATLPPSSTQTPVADAATARWSRRVVAYLIDFAPAILALVLLGYGYGAVLVAVAGGAALGSGSADLSHGLWWLAVGGVVMLVALGWQIYNRWVRGGRSGQSVGKQVTRLILVGEQTGAPIGIGYACLRDVVHILDAVAYVGFLWPLWDDRRQTFADKIMRTVVLDRRDG